MTPLPDFGPPKNQTVQEMKAQSIQSKIRTLLPDLRKRGLGRPKSKKDQVSKKKFRELEKAHHITQRVKIILDRKEVDKLLGKYDECYPIALRLRRNQSRIHRIIVMSSDVVPPTRKRPTKKLKRDSPPVKDIQEFFGKGSSCNGRFRTVVKAPTAPKVCKNGVIGEQESSGPAQVSSPDESRPVVTPGGPLPISDPTPPPAFEIVELEDGTGNQEDFIDEPNLFSDLDLSPAEIGKAVTDWIQEMLIDEFGYDFLINLFNDETTTGPNTSAESEVGHVNPADQSGSEASPPEDIDWAATDWDVQLISPDVNLDYIEVAQPSAENVQEIS